MSVDKTNKPVKIFGESKELERAILGGQMEAFKAEIDLNLARFSGHKEQILRHLRDAYNSGTKAEPFEGEKSWLWIEAAAYQYFVRQILKQKLTGSADREARYRAISKASQRARNKIDKPRRPDVAGPSIKAWLEGTKELASATEEFLDQLYIEAEFERKFENVTKSLIELEAAANQAADKVHKGRGRPKGTSVFPWNYVYALAGNYQKSTGLKPRTGDGQFLEFVREFLTAIGQHDNVSQDYVIDVIKDARTQARARSDKSIPSPFDE